MGPLYLALKQLVTSMSSCDVTKLDTLLPTSRSRELTQAPVDFYGTPLPCIETTRWLALLVNDL